MSQIFMELVTPDSLVYTGDADMVIVPGSTGDFGVLKNHSPMISTLRPGVIRIDGKKVKKYFVKAGFVEVTVDCCTVIAESSEDVTSKSEQDIEKIISASVVS